MRKREAGSRHILQCTTEQGLITQHSPYLEKIRRREDPNDYSDAKARCLALAQHHRHHHHSGLSCHVPPPTQTRSPPCLWSNRIWRGFGILEFLPFQSSSWSSRKSSSQSSIHKNHHHSIHQARWDFWRILDCTYVWLKIWKH